MYLLRVLIGSLPLPQPIRSKTSANRDLLAHVFPLFVPATCISSFDWFTGLSVSSLIGQSDYFGFGFTTHI